MASDKSIDPTATPISAAQLRQKLLEKEMEKVSQYRREQDAKQKELTKFTDEFLGHHVTEEEIATVRRLVMIAVEAGKLEAMVYSFPSELCTDSGRAINSNDPAWPQTLQGKAKEFFERYQAFGKPQGYKLKAMIINFPGGMPGDVGFFLSWAPETK
ncbi:histidine kinase [Mesorhizobium sp. ASY16-5R]|uniref:histidine kinase n=1 Tax=Mesorhizobium sp. ASY16-5R TaxID=3445772 RepID=UPI003F9F67AF